ncbi:hemicentin-1-like isoform X11 [Myxocyprinus asiaticus]|uniref:hemicentin-1-like isoform X6 n=1 Tax=Myxocyprinus asiaticus TaxID=70543 RepID=UPI00222333C4|nr:hemicentin-1-like isoform X6 [Myxocyprinus asiaticus]XP_051544904.1 hemicentin-1-like isoform X7 [Myxocyprinus asiaticus]XP_051544908.1 hemicentin-1-like isoform X7 [Myxocyprinus asiaticus]XP_051544910.1 hemicentin-1-like isoform X11 [Myxocyprinus asiaticus]XP_051544911.1 hemicentin-1-like isoform X11 [Myxocyprinus asiaticus]
METAVKFILISCLIKDVLCVFSINLPARIEALEGSCVFIPCTFDIDQSYQYYLTDATRIWIKKKGYYYYSDYVAFDSSSPSTGNLKGEIFGKPADKNCTTRFDDVSLYDSGEYYFRIEGRYDLKYSYKKEVQISVTASPSKPTVQLYDDQMEVKVHQEVMEDSSVILRCSANIYCPFNPPTLTWSSSSNTLILNEQQHQDQTKLISDLNFTITHLHHGVTFTCTIKYQLKNQIRTEQASRTLHVQYAPKNTSVTVNPSGSVLEGRSVTLTCISDGNPDVSYSWYRDTEEHLKYLQTAQNLTIIKTNPTHSGRYYCTAQNQYGTQNSSVLLDIQYAPKNTSVTVNPSGSVLEGRSVTLTCISDGNPVNYSWYRDTEEHLKHLQTGQNLTIIKTDPTHIGRYYCTAENKHGEQNSSVLLDIQYAPKNTSVTVNPSGSVLEGRSVTLTCISDGNPDVSYSWYRDTEEHLKHLQTGDTLDIMKTDPTHSGRYYCTAQNQYGTQNSSVLLDIQYAPKYTSVTVNPSGSVLEGRSVTLTCISDGNPVNYSWYRDTEEHLKHLQTGQNLTIIKTDPTHSGRYYCTAQNQYGTQNSSVLLDIQYAPKNTSVTVNPSGSVLEGRSVTLTCISDGNPPAFNYTWYRNTEEHLEHLQTGKNLTINTTDMTHSERYYCTAQNKHGEQNSSNVILNVTYAPKISNSSCKRSDVIVCVCEVRGNPSPTLEWRLSGRPIINSTETPISEEQFKNTSLRSVLTIRQSFKDTPTPHCVSTNTHGTASQQFQLLLTPQNPQGFHHPSLLVGVAIGASVMMLFCIMTLFCIRRKNFKPSQTRQEDNTGLILTQRAAVQDEEEGEFVYANKVMSHGQDVTQESLHYSSIDFTNAEPASGEIIGLSSLTTEYSVIQHHSAGESEAENNISTPVRDSKKDQTTPDRNAYITDVSLQTSEDPTYETITHR